MGSREKSSVASLSPEQEAAIKMLTSGCSIRYTALVLRVNQAEISAWIARNPAFKLMLKVRASRNLAYDDIGEAKPATSVELEVTEQLGDLVEE